MEKYRNFAFLTILIFISSFIFSSSNDKIVNLINQYYSYPLDNQGIIDIDLDQFVTGKITPSSSINYKVILNDTEEIFFDFQNELGCLYINIDKNNDNDNRKKINAESYDFKFCSNGTSNIFSLKKADINEKREQTKEQSIEGLNLFVNVTSEDSGFDFDFYSLKISLRKPEINIFEINSPHKMLCKTEQINDKNRSLFVFVFNNDTELNNKNLIIYSTAQEKKEKKVNIYADYINKQIYDNWDTDYLSENIPNNNSQYISGDMNLINIPNIETDKYIYISVESNDKTTIEIIAQIVSYEDDIKLPDVNEIKIFSINKTSIFSFEDLSKNYFISLSLVTLYGKACVKLGDDSSIDYMTDTIENQLIFNMDTGHRLIINNLEDNNETEYIFYITYTETTSNRLKELAYGKSSKIVYNDYQYQYLLFYQKLPSILLPININLQLYDANLLSIKDNKLNIDVLIISKESLYKLKLNNEYISTFNKTKKGTFDEILLASNIHLTTEDIINFDVFDDPYIIVYINNIPPSFSHIVIGTTISQMNNLMHASERIYHYGNLNGKERIVYKLKGKTAYHLMRLEFGANSESIGWSVKRTNDSENFRKNDTDLSFVTEKWINGRELLTMYIERGEDIYLTIFKNKIIINDNLTNYIFKYINSVKNGDFKNYRVKNDILSFGQNNALIINKVTNIPSYAIATYYLKIIHDNDFIYNEGINTIALIESKANVTITGNAVDNGISFNLNAAMMDKKESYYLNAYCVINENYSNYEYVAYSGIFIEGKTIEEVNVGLIWASIIIAIVIFLIIFFRSIRYYHKEHYY
jgi:hypothetical protein